MRKIIFQCTAVLAVLIPLGAGALELAGEVFGPGGDPVAEAAVWLSQDRQVRETATDAEGRFHFDGLAVGPVEVVARKPGLALGGYTGFLAGDGAIVVHLAEPATMKLRILGANYRPLAGARVRGMVVGGTFHVAVEDLAAHGFPPLRSDDEGRLAIPDLPAGSHLRLVVTHYDYADLLVPYFPVIDEPQDFTLRPGAELRGRVTVNGAGVRDARVALYMATDKGPVVSAEVLTGPEGFYRLRAAEGNYAAAVRHPDYASPPPRPVTLAGPETETSLDLELREARHIAGSVVFEGGAPAPGVRVAYRVEGTVFEETFTQADGAFSLKVGTRRGVVQVLPPQGYMTRVVSSVPFDMGDKARAELSPIVLEPLPEIQGAVVDDTGAPVPNVFIASMDMLPPYWDITDEEGRFFIRLPSMPEEANVTFRAEHPLRFLRKDFPIDLRERRVLEVRLEPFEPDLAQRPLSPAVNDLTSLVGKPAPEWECTDWFNSEPLRLEDQRGRVVVLTFWAGFDDSAFGLNRMLEMNVLAQLYADVSDVLFVAIHDATIEPPEVERYVKELGITFPVGRDALPFASFVKYGVHFIPQTVVIDKAGVFRYFQVEGRLPELIKDLRRRSE